MEKENISIGIIGIVIGAAIFIKTRSIFPSLIPIALGIAMIALCREEYKIEKRNDEK